MSELLRNLRLAKSSSAPRQNSDYPREQANIFGLLHGPSKRAAVLVPLTELAGEIHVVFIRRAVSDKDRHSGQVAFPGGRLEPEDDSLEAAALREAEEEVGLKSQHAKLIGRLHDYHTISHYQVTPVVGTFLSPYDFVLDEIEVARVFSIPLKWLANPANFHTRCRRPPQGNMVEVVYFKLYDGELLWGATARMVLNLVEVLRLS